MKGKLNLRQRKFVQEYLKDSNGLRAYIAAGFSPTGAGQGAHTLLKNVEVQRQIEVGFAKLADRANITAERNIRRIAEIAYHDKKARNNDVLKACELIGKTFGQFKDVIETDNTHFIEVVSEEAYKAADERFNKKL